MADNRTFKPDPQVPIDELNLDERNPRRSDVKAQKASLEEFGQHRPVVVQRGTNKVLIGNHLVMAARSLGWKTVWVLWVDDDDDTAVRRALADNLVADRAGWNREELKKMLAELDSVETLPGLDDRTLRDMMLEFEEELGGQEPVFPIVPKPNEKYDYVVVMAKTEIDGLWLREVLGVQPMRSYKSPARPVAASRVVTVDELKAALNEAVRRGVEYR